VEQLSGSGSFADRRRSDNSSRHHCRR
jgi:hypothetical protein